jgi:hypothetical protein
VSLTVFSVAVLFEMMLAPIDRDRLRDHRQQRTTRSYRASRFRRTASSARTAFT